jgi:2-polyprenyl-3-methyl-5-hydroxy-6-metoxy-1,4-benzoquinol methylase
MKDPALVSVVNGLGYMQQPSSLKGRFVLEDEQSPSIMILMASSPTEERRPAPARRKADADWYNDFYKKPQAGLAPWYRFLLPELRNTVRPSTRLIELGCGQGHILRVLAQNDFLPEEHITGLDQSKAAVDFCSQHLSKARFLTGDLYDLKELSADAFDVCLLMETIEHLEEPQPAIANIRRILKPEGLLYVSFPNYLHLPWLLVRILAEKLNHPNWIVLQPVDKIYTTFGVTRLFRQAGFDFIKGVGCNYGPPVLYPLETDGMTRLLNSLGLWRLSFHPILVFRKAPR